MRARRKLHYRDFVRGHRKKRPSRSSGRTLSFIINLAFVWPLILVAWLVALVWMALVAHSNAIQKLHGTRH